MNLTTTTAKRPETFGDLTRDLLTWLGRNSFEAARSACIGAAFGYGCNIVLMAVVYDGFRKTSGGFVTGQNSLIDGTLLWTIASTVIFTLYGYRKSVGKERFNKLLKDFPSTLGQLVQKDGEQSRSHLLWGAGVTFVTSEFVSPALGATVAVTMAVSAPTLIGRFFTGFLLRVWSTIMSKLAPGKKNPIETAMSMTVAILGSCAAFLVAFFVKDAIAKFIFALLCLFFASRAGKGPTPSAKVLIIVFSALALRDVVAPWIALADDGGYWENGGGLMPWLSRGGLTDLAGWSVPGGIAGGVGGAIGSALGNVLGTYPEDESANEQSEKEESGTELPPEGEEESEEELPPEEEESGAELPPEGEEESEEELPPE
ncbi:MAG: hypothetical protein K2W95_16455, partial [Candidatus Obscuribacterales bacterium]|nr:hypothetical protein [Candidatus Obscuribacterales bacterium]